MKEEVKKQPRRIYDCRKGGRAKIINARVTETQYKYVQKMAKKQDTSMSVLVLRCLEQVLGKQFEDFK